MAKLPPQRAESVALSATALSLMSMFGMWMISSSCSSIAARAMAWQLLTVAGVWGISLLHLRARRLAAEERQGIDEAERLRTEQGQARLFEGDAAEAGIACARLKEMERYGAPIASVVIMIISGGFAAWFLYSLATLSVAPEVAESLGISGAMEFGNTVFAGALTFSIAFLCFGLGKYAAGMARDVRVSLLRAGAGHLILFAAEGLLLALASAFAYFGILWPERVVAWLVPALMGVVALEMAVNLVLDFYRPRVPGETARPLYDGRVTGLLAERKGLSRTLAHTLDYQFGFNVSETWFFQFINRAIAPLILFQLGTLYLLSALVIVNPGEVAVIERWGRPRGVEELPSPGENQKWEELETPLSPGLYLKYPWPIETARKLPLKKLQYITAGAPQLGHEAEQQRLAQVRAITWDQEHTKDEFKYIMPFAGSAPADPVNGEQEISVDAMFISGGISISYSVGRPVDPSQPGIVRSGDVYRYLYSFTDPRAALVALSEREITSHLCGSNFWDVLIDDTANVERELKRRLQKASDQLGLGVQIVFVSLWNIHPPVGEVGKAFQEVVGAREEKETMIHEANAKAIARPLEAEGEAAKLLASAGAYKHERTVLSEARAMRFKHQMSAHAAAPKVYLNREYMRGVEEGLVNAKRLTILSPGIVNVMDDKQAMTAGAVGSALNSELNKENP